MIGLVRREHQHAHRRQLLPKSSGCGDAVDHRHAQVHENDVWAQPVRQRHGFAAVTRFTDDLDVGFGGEHSCQARTNDGMVVGEKNANDRRHSGAPA